MKTTQFFLLMICSLLSMGTIHAQEIKHCGSSEAEKNIREAYPELAPKMEILDEYLNHMDISKLEKTRGNKIIIPIVFHIIHNYGPENISDAQVYDQVRILNEDYQKRNPDTSAVVPSFQSLIANCNYEFRLATKDPDGNCTNGIDRIASYKTYAADDQSKLNIWNPTYYFNVWVVNTIGKSGVAGYAYKPATADMIYYYDGVLILHDYIGSIGTGIPAWSRALTHEIGHCFNLDHTWGSTNNPGVSCGDDNVLDTPPTKGHMQCLLQDSTCTPGVIENVQNYMEYAYCSNMFTKGQALRMDITLANSVAQRSSLHSALAYQFTGCNDPRPDCTPVGDFSVNRQFTCPGNSLTFKNQSFKDTVSSVNWTFTSDATPVTSTSTTNASVSFSTFGWKDISIAATSNTGTGTTTKPNYIYVADPVGTVVTGQINSFEDPSQYAKWPIFNYANNYFKWQYYDGPYVLNGWKALQFKGYDGRPFPENKTNSARGDNDEIISPAFDLSGLSVGNAYLNFNIASSTRAAVISEMDDTLTVFYTINCGSTWVKLSNYQNGSLFNNGSITGEFFPTAATSWKGISIALPAAALTNSTFIKLKYRPSDRSNNTYIDNLLIDSKPAAVSDAHQIGFAFDVIPNPAQSSSSIELAASKTGIAEITVTNMVGSVISSMKEKVYEGMQQHFNIPSVVFNTKGIYLVTVEIDHKKVSKKLVIE